MLEKFSSLVVFELIYSVWQFLVNIYAPKPMNLVKPNICPQFLLHLFRSSNKVLVFTGSMCLAHLRHMCLSAQLNFSWVDNDGT